MIWEGQRGAIAKIPPSLGINPAAFYVLGAPHIKGSLQATGLQSTVYLPSEQKGDCIWLGISQGFVIIPSKGPPVAIPHPADPRTVLPLWPLWAEPSSCWNGWVHV